MKKVKKYCSIALAALMICGVLAACRGGTPAPPPTQQPAEQTAEKPAEQTAKPTPSPTPEQTAEPTPSPTPEQTATVPDPMNISIYLWGDKPNQMDDVLAEFKNRTKDTLNVNLDFKWTPFADYQNNLSLKLAAGEAVDVCFDAPWMSMNTFILQGNYRDLTGYFGNDAYPGLKAAFDQNYIYNNLMGANGDQVFGIPLTQSFGGAVMVYLRGDLREKYGCAPVTDVATFEAYLQAIKDNEPSLIPFAMKSDGTYGAQSVIDLQDLDTIIGKPDKGIWDLNIAPGIVATMYIQDYRIKSCAIANEPVSALADFPAPYNAKDFRSLQKVRDWYDKGYLEKDVITRDDASAAFTSGLAASFEWDSAQYSATQTALTASVPGSKIEGWNPDPLLSGKFTGMKQGVYQAWNFICIPVTTPDDKAERIMKVFDWMFADRANNDLFTFGIDGKNFTAVGQDEYTYPEGLDLATNYNFPAYELCWNPNYIRYPIGYPSNVLDLMKAVNDPQVYYDPMLSGMRFNGDPVKNELANPDFVTINTEMLNLSLGIFPDVQAEFYKITDEVANNAVLQEDIAAIKAEVVSQVGAYLEKRKAQDQERGTTYPTLADLHAQMGR